MATATMKRDSDETMSSRESQRLIVTWQHPTTRAVSPVGVLSYDGVIYSFDYLLGADAVEGFKSLLGFSDRTESYASADLFPIFAQRVMDPRRPDFQRYVEDLGLREDASPWEQLTRSGGGKESDTLQLFPVPHFRDGAWTCYILLHGMRHLLEKDVLLGDVKRARYSPADFEGVLEGLIVGDQLVIEHERTNTFSDHALVATTTGQMPLGWVPDWFSGEVFELEKQGCLSLLVERANPIEAGWHMRLLVKMAADCAADYQFFGGDLWKLASAE